MKLVQLHTQPTCQVAAKLLQVRRANMALRYSLYSLVTMNVWSDSNRPISFGPGAAAPPPAALPTTLFVLVPVWGPTG